MGTYVLVHGAWHTGKQLEPVAIQSGQPVTRFTLRRSKETGRGTRSPSGLDEAIQSVVEYVNEK